MEQKMRIIQIGVKYRDETIWYRVGHGPVIVKKIIEHTIKKNTYWYEVQFASGGFLKIFNATTVGFEPFLYEYVCVQNTKLCKYLDACSDSCQKILNNEECKYEPKE